MHLILGFGERDGLFDNSLFLILLNISDIMFLSHN